jgi:N-acetylmuramoyl-L-alanine amidase-like protein
MRVFLERLMSKRLLTLTALCLGALATWVAAPAFSLKPYAPKPVDFAQKLPRLERVQAIAGAASLRSAAVAPTVIDDGAREGPVRWISPVVTAPKRFDAVGIPGEERPVEFRTRRDGEPWTGWAEVDNGDPVWAGHSDQVQVRARDFRPSGELYYVNTSGTDSTAHRLLTGARSAIHGAFVSVAATPLAGAQPLKPPVVSREQWGASSCPPRTGPSYGKVKATVIHHTVNTNSYTSTDAPGMVLAICRFHRNGNGWNDIGYNALVDRYGVIYEGRAGGLENAVVGAHAQGFNSLTAGFAVIGDFRSVQFPVEAVASLKKLIAWKLFTIGRKQPKQKVKLRSGGGSLSRYPKGKSLKTWRVTYHSKLGKTDCPGSAGRKQITGIRKGAQSEVNNPSSGAVTPAP